MTGHVVAMGGGGFYADPTSPLDDFILSLSPAPRPRVCFVPTPAGDSDRAIAAFFEAFAARECVPSCLRLFGVPESPAEQLASQDVIYVSGGNTANALALWRLHGVDRALREAWERGAVLGGVSAGANCWFECCVTDSFGPQLAPLRDGLALLAGSFCPRYDGEPLRRPVYRELVANGFPPGYAADDGAALHFVGTELREVVTCKPGARVPRGARSRDAARAEGALRSGLPGAGTKLGRPRRRAEAEPERRQEHVEDDVRDEEQNPPEREPSWRRPSLLAEVAAPAGRRTERVAERRLARGPARSRLRHAFAAARFRRSTRRMIRMAVSSTESSETLITGQRRRRWTLEASSSSR